MADTDTETLPNGTGPLSAEEEERLKQRPADIDADVREMERRKRVEALMSSKLFREELERVLDQQMHEGNDAPLLQRIREMVGGRLHTGSLRGPSCVLPINDIRGIEGVGYEKGEKILRCKLAAVYRLVDLFGWTQTGASGQITARLNTAVEQVLTTPRGLLPHEVTASSLVKVDMQGVVQDQGTTNFPVNVEGFSLHASVHAARPDVRCVLHVRSVGALAVSATKRGLLPLCNEAALLGDVAYHRVPNGLLDNEEQEKLVRALGPHAKILILSGGGALCCGATLEEAFYQAKNLNAACEVQLRLASLPLDELTLLDEETRRQMYESSRKPPGDAAKWRVGGEEFEALMRMLDNAGFRTGYIYRHPLVKNDVPKPKNDVEVPPAVSSLGYLLEEEELYRQGLWKKGGAKAGERTRWLNSPNVYQKVEVLETGTSDPKKITKWVDANNEEWVQDGSPAHSSTPVKIDTLQFVPKNTNPKEFKKLQQQIKENRRADKISAGPQSHILEGVTWDEAAKLVGEDAANTHTGDHVVLMGAASKGIIQRGYQHNATMYSAPYARNPFDHVTDTEIDDYRRTVERKQRSDYDTDISESEAVSAAQMTSPNTAPSDTEEESRDEQRVLRIETKQVPVRSQPEVVLSDVDTTDFLNAERHHADRTRGTVLTAANSNEALSSHKRTIHNYPRNPKFDHVVQKYESDKHPKCKLNLNHRLGNVNDNALALYNPGTYSSRSSLYSIPSIDSDRCRDYPLRTRSLPRKKSKETTNTLYRTRSHSGFINSYIKDPEPNHYHLPRCNSCGTIVSSYPRETRDKNKGYNVYLSVDNIPDTCRRESRFDVVRVKKSVVSVFKVPTQEFVDSQEFNEDNYLGDIGNSFSSNQTVIEKNTDCREDSNVIPTSASKGSENINEAKEVKRVQSIKDVGDDIYKAVPVNTDNNSEDLNITIESVEGEYHSFTDDMYFEEIPYESPVKELVEKDIRDYSVPIDFYCDDYCKKDSSPKKSPTKKITVLKNILEPILEESKSSYEDSGNNSKLQNKELATSVVVEDKNISKNKMTENPATENVRSFNNLPEKCHLEKNDNSGYTSSILSVTTSEKVTSFDSTMEFEKYELIAEIVSSILDKIQFYVNEDEVVYEKKVFFESVTEESVYEERYFTENVICSLDIITEEVQDIDNEEVFESFSITQMVENLRRNQNETVLTESSESEVAQTVAEAILYFIFDNAFYCATKGRGGNKKNKKVFTVVDYEDIMFTTLPGWLGFDDRFSNVTDKINDDDDDDFHINIKYINDKEVNNEENYEPDANLRNLLRSDENRSNLTSEINNNVEVVSNFNELFNFYNAPHQIEDFIVSSGNSAAFNDYNKNSNVIYEKDIHSGRELQNLSENDEQLDVKEMSNSDSFYSNEVTESEQDIARIEDTSSFSYHDMYNELEDKTDNSEQFDSKCHTLEKSFKINENSENKNDDSMNETFVLNTAFVEGVGFYGRSSSPERSHFDECTVSPIKHTNEPFVGDDLCVLYEKDDIILGSPFVKKANVLPMSQTVHSGGVKYWLSFDDSLDLETEKPKRKPKCPDDKQLPSFLVVDFDNKEKSNFAKEFESIAGSTKTKRRSGVLLNNDNLETQRNDTIMTEASDYNTCESTVHSKPETSFEERIMLDSLDTNDREKLIFDSRVVAKRRLRHTWPPFEHTIFYRIISQFRLSESFDLSDLDKARFETSL